MNKNVARLTALIALLPSDLRLTAGSRERAVQRLAEQYPGLIRQAGSWYRFESNTAGKGNPDDFGTLANGAARFWDLLEETGYARREEGRGMTESGELPLPTYVVGPLLPEPACRVCRDAGFAGTFVSGGQEVPHACFACAKGDPRMAEEETCLLRLPLDCAFDDAWSRNEEGKMVCDEDVEDRLAGEYARKHGCTVQLLLRQGPAGGNPLYCFFGTRAALRSLCLDHADGDEEEADFLLEEAAPLGTPVPEVEARRTREAIG